jgi:hypothetical protein
MARLDEPVIGYRSWRATADDLLESSYVEGCLWSTQMNAYCDYEKRDYRFKEAPKRGGILGPLLDRYLPLPRPPEHMAPHKPCVCGLYGFANPKVRYFSRKHIHGAVVGWGRTCLHRDGFRSERMRILALCLEGDLERVRRIADRYGVPAVPPDQLEAFASEFGRPVPQQPKEF